VGAAAGSKAAAGAQTSSWDWVLPDLWLLAERPTGAADPTDLLAGPPPGPDMPLAGLVRPAEIRWRIEHDYRQLNMAWDWATSQTDRGPAAVITGA
jgi:hypothetical protein